MNLNPSFIPETKLNSRDFPGGPVIKASSSNAGGAGSIPGQRVKIPLVLGPKKKNQKTKHKIGAIL